LVQEQIEAVEAEHGDDWEIGDVTCILEVRFPDGFEEVRVRSSGSSAKGIGLLTVAQGIAMQATTRDSWSNTP
jgi:hypothetical protein